MSLRSDTNDTWHLGPGRVLSLARPHVLGILNATPDSFHADSRTLDPRHAVDLTARMIDEGAIGVDLGGESTRPGALRIAPAEQMARVLPIIRALRHHLGPEPVITIDTTIAAVASAAIDAGADAVNDVSAGTEDPALIQVCAKKGKGLILMHRLAPPDKDRYSTQYDAATTPRYADVTREVAAFLAQRLAAAVAAGVPREGIVLDPGLGFGKSVEQNLTLIRTTTMLRPLGRPILSALSRKSFTAAAAGIDPNLPPSARLTPTLALSVAHLHAGARLFRVHDVQLHVQALAAAWRCLDDANA